MAGHRRKCCTTFSATSDREDSLNAWIFCLDKPEIIDAALYVTKIDVKVCVLVTGLDSG